MGVSKSALIKDLRAVDVQTDNVITRNFYREHGKYSEVAWQVHFPKFEDFCQAAGVERSAPEVNEIDGTTWSVFIPKTALCTAEDIIKHCKVDLSVWELDRFRAKDVSKDGNPLFQISAFFRKRKDVLAILAEIENMRSEIERMKSGAKSFAPIPVPVVRMTESSDNLLEINISDMHFGKLAWPIETGHEPYDIHIAEAMFVRALDTLIERTKSFTFSEILFVVGNDLLNSDNPENTTTKGTIVTTDVRYHKTFRIVRKTITDCVEKLRLIAPVKVLIVPGNHDQLASYHLGDSLECWFHNYTDVIVENQPRYRKYHEFGKVMLAFTHGDKGDRNDYPLLMATEEPEMFGRTKFREMHTGHTHKTKLDEQFGVRVRVIPALCPPDDWHAENGYVGNLRTAEAYVWNREQGLINMAFYNDEAFPILETKRGLI